MPLPSQNHMELETDTQHYCVAVVFYFRKNYCFICYSLLGKLILISFQFQLTVIFILAVLNQSAYGTD